jgi:hypothetical protein
MDNKIKDIMNLLSGKLAFGRSKADQKGHN